MCIIPKTIEDLKEFISKVKGWSAQWQVVGTSQLFPKIRNNIVSTILIIATYLTNHSSCFRIPARFFCSSALICPVNRRRAGGEPTLPNSVNISSLNKESYDVLWLFLCLHYVFHFLSLPFICWFERCSSRVILRALYISTWGLHLDILTEKDFHDIS